MTERKNDFSKGSIVSNILKIAAPMTLALIINMLYNVVDRMYLGNMPGSGRDALTGIGLAFPVIMVVSAFQNLVSAGGAPLCSIARGRGDEEEARLIQGNCYFLLLIFGVALTVIGLIVKGPVLRATGASDVTFGYANDYLTIYLLGTVFVMTGLGMNNFINSQGFAKTGMMSVLIGAVVNIALDPLFIFVFDMGVRGAALATIIAQACSALWVLMFLKGKRAIIQLRPKYFRIKADIIKRIMALGVTGFTMAATNSAVGMIYNVRLNELGGDVYIGAMTVINSLREITSLPLMGLGNGASPVLSFNYGAGEYKRVKQIIKTVALISVGSSLVIWAIVMIFPAQLIRIFNSDAELLDIGVKAVRVYFAVFFMMAFQHAGQTSFMAMNRPKEAIFFSMFRKIILVVPLIYLLPSLTGTGAMGIFLSEPISDVIGGLACFLTMVFTMWPRLKEQEK